MTKIPWLCEVSSTWWGGGTRFSRFVNLKTCGFFQPQTWILEKKLDFQVQKSDETIEFPNIQVWCCGLILWCTAGAHGLEPATTGAGFRRFSTLAVDVGVPFLSAEDALRQSAALPESYLWVASLQGCDRNSQCHRENPHTSSHFRTQVESVEVMPGQVWVSRKRIGKDHQ